MKQRRLSSPFLEGDEVLGFKKRTWSCCWNHLITDDVRSFQTKSIWRLQPHTHALITQNIYFKVWLGIKSGWSSDMEEDDWYGSGSAGQFYCPLHCLISKWCKARERAHTAVPRWPHRCCSCKKDRMTFSAQAFRSLYWKVFGSAAATRLNM